MTRNIGRWHTRLLAGIAWRRLNQSWNPQNIFVAPVYFGSLAVTELEQKMLARLEGPGYAYLEIYGSVNICSRKAQARVAWPLERRKRLGNILL